MFPDTAPTQPWFVRLLTASFRLGRFFGTEVRVYGASLILLLLIALPLQLLSFLPLGLRLAYVFGGLLTLYFCVWFHEMGHVWAARRYHIKTPRITLSPLGGLAHLDAAAPSPRAEIVIALAGPATHLVLLSVLWPVSRLIANDWTVGPLLLHHALALNLSLLLFNLLPCYPLDGGRVLRGLLAGRMHPNRATLWAAHVGIVGAIGFIVWGLVGLGNLGGGLLIAIGIGNLFACFRARLEARYSDGPYGEPRQPWEQDAEAWKLGPEPEPRAERRAAPRPPPGPGDEAELDRLLDRVREVGLAGLSEREREALRRASEARRSR